MATPRSVQIWHNPRCSKSRQALALLQDHQPELKIEVIDYLASPPDRSTLERVASLVTGGPAALVRFKDEQAQALGLSHGDSPQMLLDALAAHPRLIERPVVVQGERALVARPPDLLTNWVDPAHPADAPKP